MHKKLFFFLLSTIWVVAATAQSPQSHYVLFDSDSHDVTAQEASDLLEALGEFAYIRSIRIEAHTDSDGSDDYNVALAERRLASVEKVLTANGYSINRKGSHGEDSPIASNETEDGKQQNRRVMVRFEGDRKLVTMESIYESLLPPLQSYCVDNTKDTTLVANSGTVVIVPAYTFKTENYDDCIELRLREALNTSEMLAMNIHTQSDGDMLQSGGTIYLEAYLNGEKISDELINGMRIVFPTDQQADDMTVFTANSDGIDMNWENTDEPFNYIPYALTSTAFTIDFYSDPANFRCRLFWCKIKRLFGKKEGESRPQTRDTRQYMYGYALDTAFYSKDPEIRAAAIAQFQALQDQISDASAMFVGKVNRLGYINCDRFPNERKEQILVTSGDSDPADIRLIVPSVNGMMVQRSTNGSASFTAPVKRETYIVAIKVVDNESYLCIRDNESMSTKVVLEYEKLTPTQIKHKLNGLNT